MNKPDGRYRYVRGMWDREEQKLIESDPVMEGMDEIDAWFSKPSKLPTHPTEKFVAQLFWIIGNYLRELDKRTLIGFDPRTATATSCCEIADRIRRLRNPEQ